MNTHGIQNLCRFLFDNEHIYFSDEDSRIIAAYNRNTKKIDWKFSLSQEGINKEERPRYARTLKLHQNRLYALDNKNTLHVFEKDNTNIDI